MVAAGNSVSMFGKILQAASSGRIAGLTGTHATPRLLDHEILRCRVSIEVLPADPETVANQAAAVFRSERGANFGSFEYRPVFSEIGDLAVRVTAEIISARTGNPGPRLPDMMKNRLHRNFLTLPSIAGTNVPIPRIRTAHDSSPWYPGRMTVKSFRPCFHRIMPLSRSGRKLCPQKDPCMRKNVNKPAQAFSFSISCCFHKELFCLQIEQACLSP